MSAPNTFPQRHHPTRLRHHELAAGLRPLPNLFVRSVSLLALLYGILTVLLITAVECGFISAFSALLGGVVTVVVQFIFGPWILDLSLRFLYRVEWVEPDLLPAHVRTITEKICVQHRIRFPSFGIIDDGAPQAFTYGHYPSNARVVLSRGIFELLTPDEVDAVVAHEMGHVCHWDMVVMTIAQLVPLLAYYIYRMASEGSDRKSKENSAAMVIAGGAYIVYIVSQLVVLWFSRTREYYADRFAGKWSASPNVLASALVKIGYGLASGGAHPAAKPPDSPRASHLGGSSGFATLNIFDRKAALNLVVAAQAGANNGHFDPEVLKGVLQWDLWNPWATFFEIQSTHPLIAKRLERLCDQSAQLQQEPLVVFDRQKPESYWDEFLIDVVVTLLPLLTLVLGLGTLTFAAVMGGVSHSWYAVLVLFLGLSLLLKTYLAYRARSFPKQNVADLLQEVKVSPIRPVAASLRGTIIGKGIPGLIWSEDFVLHDGSGIIFLDYRQPLRFWEFLFGLLKAKDLQGKDVEVRGWYRRAPVPYLEIASITLIGEARERRCYVKLAKVCTGSLLTALGALLLVAL
ncbi:MAG: M48 family metalloprotease [Pseudomonadota bacterium]|jgi:Zn-dependent protease with chaperone function